MSGTSHDFVGRFAYSNIKVTGFRKNLAKYNFGSE